MPTLIAPLVQAVGTAITGAAVAAGTVTAISYAITLVGTLALSSYQKRKAERTQRAAYESSVVDRLVNTQGTVVPRELVLGRVRKAGNVFFQWSVAPYNSTFVTAIALAAHEIDGIERIYFNDQPIDLDAGGNVTTAPWGKTTTESVTQTSFGAVIALDHTPIAGSVKVTWFKYGGTDNTGGGQSSFSLSGNVVTINDWEAGINYYIAYQWTNFLSVARVYVHLGSPGQAADPRFQLFMPGVWTAAHRAAGVAYLSCEFVYEESAFPNGLPTISAQLRGAKIYDPRSGATVFTENPALMMRHVLLHPQFGKRTSLTLAEEHQIIAAANACELMISYYGYDWVQMYRAALVAQFGSPARDILDDLAQAMGGEWAYAAGEFLVRAGVYQLPVMNLSDADLATVQRSNDGSTSQNPTTISPHRPRNDKINIVAARIWDQAANYIETPITPYRADALIAADGAELSQEVTMPAVFYAGQAFHIAGIMLRDGRDPMTTTLMFKMSAYPLELFDTVTLTLARYGWNAKEFRVLGRNFVPGSGVQLTLKETSPAIYVYGAGFVPQGHAPNSGLPKPWDIHPPTIVSIFSGESELIVQNDGTIVNGVRVTWLPIQDASIVSNGNVEVQYFVLPDGPWRNAPMVNGDATETKFTGLDDLAMILIRARTRNSLAVSDWSAQLLHQVVGKTEPPPDMENLNISGSVLAWTMPRRVPDLAGFVFRFHYGNNLDWNSAVPLHTGVITESPYDLVTRPGGVVTIMGKALDTTGNESAATANIVMDLGDPLIANIIEQIDFKALGWPAAAGEQYGWTEAGGDLVADALDSFYGSGNQSFYGGDTDPFYDMGAYGQMVYVTEPVAITSALAGSIMTLQTETDGIDLVIEYRLSGPGSFYGPDSASFYDEDDSLPFFGGPGQWLPWPGQLVAANDGYQFRVTIGAGTTQGALREMVLTIDAPDVEEQLSDVAIAAGGTVIPYSANFKAIKTVQATLQANSSGATKVLIDKTNALSPVIVALDAADTSVSGSTADITLKGY